MVQRHSTTGPFASATTANGSPPLVPSLDTNNDMDGTNNEDRASGTSSAGYGQWSGESDWVVTTPDSLLAVTPPGGEGSAWIHVPASLDRQMRTNKHHVHSSSPSQQQQQQQQQQQASSQRSPLASTSYLLSSRLSELDTSSAIPRGDVLIEAVPLQKQAEHSMKSGNHSSSSSRSSSSMTDSSTKNQPLSADYSSIVAKKTLTRSSSPARMLDAHLEADLVASVTELFVCESSRASPTSPSLLVDSRDSLAISDLSSSAEPPPPPSASSTNAHPSMTTTTTTTTNASNEIPVITISPTLRPFPSACTPPNFGTLTATLRSTSAFRRPFSQINSRSSWPASPHHSMSLFGLASGMRIMQTTPPAAEVDVQLVAGASEMEALMTLSASTDPNTTETGQLHRRTRSTEKAGMSDTALTRSSDDHEELLGPDSDSLWKQPLSTSPSEGSPPIFQQQQQQQQHGSSMYLHDGQAAVRVTRPQRRKNTSAGLKTSNTSRKHESTHRYRGSLDASFFNPTNGSKHSSKRGRDDKSTTDISISVWAAALVSVLLFGAGFGAGSLWRSLRCHCSVAA